MKNNRLEIRRQKISKEVDAFVKHSFNIVDNIHNILVSKGMDQKDLSKLLNKSESEISKWMTGTHNFTIKSIAKIEAALGQSILTFVRKDEKKYDSIIINYPYFNLEGYRKAKNTSTTTNYNYFPQEEYKQPTEFFS